MSDSRCLYTVAWQWEYVHKTLQWEWKGHIFHSRWSPMKPMWRVCATCMNIFLIGERQHEWWWQWIFQRPYKRQAKHMDTKLEIKTQVRRMHNATQWPNETHFHLSMRFKWISVYVICTSCRKLMPIMCGWCCCLLMRKCTMRGMYYVQLSTRTNQTALWLTVCS